MSTLTWRYLVTNAQSAQAYYNRVVSQQREFSQFTDYTSRVERRLNSFPADINSIVDASQVSSHWVCDAAEHFDVICILYLGLTWLRLSRANLFAFYHPVIRSTAGHPN
ncbi:hypothetical protein CONCODRAFT_12361 [Conidiobolus coronatus NRRL 28638]|uniref:Uncharacterized protein n=1 Tax=Conidiobolus coronatus (strain ATCC 28846 / CBS 209.66 / NRRL 28638) TaxID=796925 RepID=A0A137NT58_CONC2|nr:hypothetical protein CONCODRAFT_12361 [Conidiobolus coronatus NRRL 28638]|eukprot:KXN65920.1 hypothetical protein CONCODRAFT_12361 [Conidiobolus coronatus NRRL 28638]